MATTIWQGLVPHVIIDGVTAEEVMEKLAHLDPKLVQHGTQEKGLLVIQLNGYVSAKLVIEAPDDAALQLADETLREIEAALGMEERITA